MTNEYVQHFSGLVRVIDFKKFGHALKFYPKGAFGHIFIEIKNGLVQNYVDFVVYEDEVDSAGNPIISELNLTPYIKYDLHDSVMGCLWDMSRLGILSQDTQISSFLLQNFKRSILVQEWSDDAPIVDVPIPADVMKPEYSVPVPEAFVDYLLSKMEEVEKQGHSFSKEWYLLRICLFYFLPEELSSNDIYNIGYFSAQMSEKFRMEDDAIRAQKAQLARQKGSLIRSLSAPQNREKKDAVIISLRDEVIAEHGPSSVHIDTTAASYIHELAERKRPPELWIDTKRRVISESSIRNALGRLRKSGKIV